MIIKILNHCRSMPERAQLNLDELPEELPFEQPAEYAMPS